VIAVFRALSTGQPIEAPTARARDVSALSRPGRSLPGQNKEPFVKTLVVRSGALSFVALGQTVINLVSFDVNAKRD
jgi:hypothetical protein